MFRDDPCSPSAPVSAQPRPCSAAARWRSAEARHPVALFPPLHLGDAEVTVVSDGPLPLGPPKGTFIGVPDDEVQEDADDNFLSPDNVVLEQNSPIVNMGDKLVLFDTGMGTSKAFGPTTGRQQKSMAEAGIKPGDIDAVVFSHAHIDHIGGIVDDRRQAAVPQRAVLHRPERFRFLDRRRQARQPAEGLRRACAQEPDAGARPAGVLQGRPGIPARHSGASPRPATPSATPSSR